MFRFFRRFKRQIVTALSALMVLQCGIHGATFGDKTSENADIEVTRVSLVSAIREALDKADTVDTSEFLFTGDYVEEYEELFGLSEDVVLYPLSLKGIEKATNSDIAAANFSAYLKVNYSDSDETEIGTVTGNEQIIFLFKNKKNKTKRISADLLGTKKIVSIPGKQSDLSVEDEENIATFSNANIPIEVINKTATDSNAYYDEEPEDTDDNEISVLQPVLLNNVVAVALFIQADDIVKAALSEEYSYETKSAVITAYVTPDTFSVPVTMEVREFDSDEENAMTDMLRSKGQLFTGTKSFDIHFLTEDEDEIEPDKPIDISICLKENILPEDVDPESLAVCHITDENSSIMPVTDMETEALSSTEDNGIIERTIERTIEGTIEDENKLQFLPTSIEKDGTSLNVRFTTESFSYFVMSYNGYNNLWAYLYDEDGNQLPGTREDTDEIWANPDNKAKYNPQDFCANWNGGSGSAASNGKWVSFSTLTSLLGDSTTGYTYVNAYTDSAMEESFNWIYFEQVSGYSGSWWVSTLTDKPTAAPSETDGTSRKITADTDGYMKLYIRMRNDTITSPIEDCVEENGYFLAKAPENLPKYATVNYKWYRSDDGENFEEVVRKKAANKTYNIEIDETGSKLYPSRDTSIDVETRRWYKAEVYVDGKLYKEYSKRQVEDYPCIMNGSFETPSVSLIGEWMYDFPNGTNGLYWRTTGDDHQIEIIKESSWAGNAYNCSTASGDGGVQWAELNAEKEGALYQHVLVQPESTLYWHFAHRGRNGTDTMYMVIAPKNKISSSSSTAELVAIAKKIVNGEGEYTEANGYQALKVEDGNTSWAMYEGEYTVLDDVWLLDFFFISASGTTLGNMIDDVSFSTTVPGPVEGCANITAVETVSGLLSDDMANLTMKIWLEDADGNVASDKNGILAERMVTFGAVAEENGDYTKTVTFPNMPDDTEYTLKKALYFNGTAVIPDGYNHLLEAYTVKRNGVLEDKGLGSESTFMTYDEARDKIHVDFVDRFEIENVPVTITKKLVGNAVEDDRDFSFTLSGTLKNGSAFTDEISDEDKSFTLKGGESKTIQIPFGSSITVSEENLSDEHYVTYHEIVPGETEKGNDIIIPEMISEKEIAFTNKRVKTDVAFKKVDENGERLSGATLTLYNGRNLSADKEIGTFTTDGINDWTMTLMNGDYTLVESTAPDGYRIADAIIVHVSESGVVTCEPEGMVKKTGDLSYMVTMTNKKLIGSVILENEINETYEPFGTPSFIYEITSKDGTYKKVIMLTMDALKKNEALDLPAGEYTVKQVSVSRYVPETDTIDFTVTDGKTVKLPFKNTIKQYEKFSHVTQLINRITQFSEN